VVRIRAIADDSAPEPWEFEDRDPEPSEFCDDSYPLPWTYDDGGAGPGPEIYDCVARAIAIATGKPYTEVFSLIDVFVDAACTWDPDLRFIARECEGASRIDPRADVRTRLAVGTA
jgi:hypothetical protein